MFHIPSITSKIVYNNAGYATDELRAFVDYFTFEDMSESSVDDIVSAL
mgnify:CR=1 FL=1